LGLAEISSAILKLVGGPVGIFLVSLISNSIPFVTIPYLGIIAGYSVFYRDLWAQIMLITSSSLGAATGKIVVYFLGSAARKGLSETSKRNVELFKKLARRSLFLAILFLAATPLPDDILYIPLGLMKYPILPYFTAILIGKVIITSVVVVYASWITAFATSNIYTVPLWIALTVVLIYIVMKIDWYNVLEEVSDKGFFKYVSDVLRNIMHRSDPSKE
jgi:membrane protein YqaA with SNARE-associated domain